MSQLFVPSTSGRRVGYVRVSTDDQTVFQYTDALEAAGCFPVFVEEPMSAVSAHRPALAEAEDELTSGDAFVVLSIDRAFRSTLDALLFLDRINRRGVTFISIYQMIDTNTPEGRKWFTDAASNAEYERAVISRRTRDKMAAAKRRGQHLGRPYKLSRRRVVRAHSLVTIKGLGLSHVASLYGVAPITLKRAFVRIGLEVGSYDRT